MLPRLRRRNRQNGRPAQAGSVAPPLACLAAEPSRPRMWFPTLVALAVAVFYYCGASPWMTLEDAGQLSAVAHSLGVTHSPGYPLWTFCGWLCAHWGGEPLAGLLLCSVLPAGMAVGLACWFWGAARVDRLSVGMGAVLLACCLPVWSQAVIVEVYSLALLLALLTLVALSRLSALSWAGVVWLAAVWAGALASHQTYVVWTPFLLLFVWWQHGCKKAVAWGGAVVVLVLGYYLLLWVYSARDPAATVAVIETWVGWRSYVLRDQYGRAGNPGIPWEWLLSCCRMARPVYLEVFVLAASFLAARRWPSRKVPWWLVGTALGGTAVLSWLIWARELEQQQQVLLIPFLPVLLVPLILAVPFVWTRFPLGVWLTVAVGVAALAVVRIPQCLQVNRPAAGVYQRAVRTTLPTGSVFLTCSDAGTGVGMYEGYARTKRPKFETLSLSLSLTGVYMEHMARRLPQYKLPREPDIARVVSAVAQTGIQSGVSLEGVVTPSFLAEYGAGLAWWLTTNYPQTTFYAERTRNAAVVRAVVPTNLFFRLYPEPKPVTAATVARQTQYWRDLHRELTGVTLPTVLKVEELSGWSEQGAWSWRRDYVGRRVFSEARIWLSEYYAMNGQPAAAKDAALHAWLLCPASTSALGWVIRFLSPAEAEVLTVYTKRLNTGLFNLVP